MDLKLMPPDLGAAVVQAAQAVADGKLDDQFVVDIFQTGSGTSTNMNTNEVIAGLANVPSESKDAGRGMGMTERQLLWRVELPLAIPELIAGLRIATVSTVAIASLMVFANVNTLGAPLYQQITFKTNIVIAGGLTILMAISFDFLLLLAQRLLAPWRRSDREATV